MQILERLQLVETENTRLREENQALREQLRLLLQQLERSQLKKDSHNSHNPPSQDKSKPPRTKSLRKKSSRKSGGTPILSVKLQESFKHIWVNNAGLDGHSTFGHIILLKDFIINLKPKYVLFLIGNNEIGKIDFEDHTASQIKGKIRVSSPEAFAKSLAAYSELANLFLNLCRYLRAKTQGFPHQEIDLTALEQMNYPEAEQDNVLAEHRLKYIPVYKKRLYELIRLAKDHDIEPILITQPALYGIGTDEVTRVNLAGIRIGAYSGDTRWKILELYNNVTRVIGEKQDLLVMDLAAEMPKNSAYYYDFIHYTKAGAQKVAEIVHKNLIPYLNKHSSEYVFK
jgi:hypothetical protein